MKKLILSLTLIAMSSFCHAGPIEDLASSIKADYDSVEQTPNTAQAQSSEHNAQMSAETKRRAEQSQKEQEAIVAKWQADRQTQIDNRNKAKEAAKFPATLEDAKDKMIELFDIPKSTIYSFHIDDIPVHRASISWKTYRGESVAGSWRTFIHGRTYDFETQTLISQYDD